MLRSRRTTEVSAVRRTRAAVHPARVDEPGATARPPGTLRPSRQVQDQGLLRPEHRHLQHPPRPGTGPGSTTDPPGGGHRPGGSLLHGEPGSPPVSTQPPAGRAAAGSRPGRRAGSGHLGRPTWSARRRRTAPRSGPPRRRRARTTAGSGWSACTTSPRVQQGAVALVASPRAASAGVALLRRPVDAMSHSMPKWPNSADGAAEGQVVGPARRVRRRRARRGCRPARAAAAAGSSAGWSGRSRASLLSLAQTRSVRARMPEVDPAAARGAGLDLDAGVPRAQLVEQPVERQRLGVRRPGAPRWPASTRSRLWSHLR